MHDTMSSGDPMTRERILRAARELLDQTPGADVSMGQVAKRAGVSRQALYLHFADRASLFLAVSRAADSQARTAERQRRIDEAPTARAALREAIAVQALIKGQLRGVATTMDALRRTDPAADAAWKEREHARLHRCEQVAKRLLVEGELSPSFDAETAARLLWATTSQRVWEDLVVDQGWSTEQYRKHLTALLESALLRRLD